MFKTVLFFIGMFFVVPPCVADLVPSSLEIYSVGESYPVSYEEDGQAKGFNNELIQAIQAHLKYNNTISIVPWSRAYHKLLVKPNVVFTSISRTKEREKYFHMLGPITRKEVVFFKKANSPLKIDSIEDIMKVDRIAVRRNTVYENILRQKNFKDLVMTEDVLQCQRLLEGNRVDLFLDNHFAPEVLKKENMDPKVIQKAHALMTLDAYLAFSKGTSLETIKEWKKTFQKIKEDGTFEKIHRRWIPDAEMPLTIEETHPLEGSP